jgi:hypothetical protein
MSSQDTVGFLVHAPAEFRIPELPYRPCMRDRYAIYNAEIAVAQKLWPE